ncbi:MAG: hypothetical protein NVS2B3_13250 [Vulcanimicrobiaceae bacterium]
MSDDDLRARYPEAVEAVRAFFERFYGTQIAILDSQDDALPYALGEARKIVAVGADFLATFEPGAIEEHLAAWNVAHLSRTLEAGSRLNVTSDGPEEERTIDF